MIRLITVLVTLYLVICKAYGQFIVYQDAKGQVLTTFDTYSSGLNTAFSGLNMAAHNQITYLGSPFLTFPVWQKGKIKLDRYGEELPCKLAYNLVTNEVLCRFSGDSTVKVITPDVFTINGTEFVRQQNKVLGIDYRMYTTVVYDGQTKLLMSLSSVLKTNQGSNGYNRDLNNKGAYQTKTKYYIRKGNARPEVITFTKNSILAVLYDQAEKIAAKLSAKQLTMEDVVGALTYYDALVAANEANKPALSNDPIFKQTLHEKITYPNQAWNQGIYARVYAGFEVDQQGIVKNIIILSPDNVGFGLSKEVNQALAKLPNLAPSLSGKYALPVAFTYTNSKENTGPHLPVNRLPDDRFENRTILEEIVVPAVVSKPVITSREVWGYYK